MRTNTTIHRTREEAERWPRRALVGMVGLICLAAIISRYSDTAARIVTGIALTLIVVGTVITVTVLIRMNSRDTGQTRWESIERDGHTVWPPADTTTVRYLTADNLTLSRDYREAS